MKVTKKTTTATSKTTAGTKKPGSGARIRELILTGMDNEKILAVVKKEFKEGKTKISDVSWNRSQLKAGKFDAPKKVLTNAEALEKSAPKPKATAKPAEAAK